MQYSNYLHIPMFESFCKQNSIDGKEISAKISGVPLKLKVASTPESLLSGYSGKPEPKSGEGMLFVYQEETPLQFWMKDVNYPLDIIFFDSNMEYVHHCTMNPCGDLGDSDLPRYSSNNPAQFAVELPGGWCDSNLKENCSLSI